MADPLKDNLIKSLNLENLSEEKRNEILEKMGEVINKRVVNRVAEELSDEQLDEFNELMGKQPTGEQIVEFLSQRIENFDSIVQEEVAKFKKESSDFIAQIKGE